MRRIEWMAVGWGGLFAAIGLLAGTNRSGMTLLIAVVVSFAFGGFLAGVRASELRVLHAFLAGVGAYLFHAVFIVLAHLADVLGGPSAPGFLPGSNGQWGITAAIGFIVAAIGGGTAGAWLRPQGRDQHRRAA